MVFRILEKLFIIIILVLEVEVLIIFFFFNKILLICKKVLGKCNLYKFVDMLY